jgi:hypothetical protein
MEFPEISEGQISQLVNDMNSTGFSLLPGCVSEKDLARCQSFVDEAVTESAGEYVHFNGPEAVSGSGLDALAECRQFKALLHRIYEVGMGHPGPDQKFYQVLRCLAGAGGQKNSMIFHYDSYVVTALIPIRIPESGQSGDLVMWPNTRRVRRTYFVNVLDKVILDNPLAQIVLKFGLRSNRLPLVRIKMRPGNLYLFWGYRSVHTNEPCDLDKIRATALFHYGNPHRPN